MAYDNGHITYPVSIHDVQRALGASSTDLATLCMHENINLWARYRPVPCNSYNTVNPITDLQRQQERYGILLPIDPWVADIIQNYEDYANDLALKNGYYIRTRPWGDRHWKRLTDFVKTDNNGAGVSGKGYDHKAQMDFIIITLNGENRGTYYLCPLVDEGSRELYIPDGETVRFLFPYDRKWMDEYFKYLLGQPNHVVELRRTNDEWLSAVDLMGVDQYGDKEYSSSKRRILIFHWEQKNHVYQWVFKNYVTDNSGGDSSSPDAYLDLSSNGYDDNSYNHFNKYPDDPVRQTDWERNHHDEFLKYLEGRYLFIDCWVGVNDSQNIMPIPAFAYEVNIHREEAPIQPVQHVYINEWFQFKVADDNIASVLIDSGSITFVCYVNTEKFQGIINGNDYVEQNANIIMSQLRTLYDSITLTVGTMNFNLFTNIIEAYVSREEHGEHGVLWKEMYLLVYLNEQASLNPTTAEINAMVKQQASQSIAGHDDLLIST